MEDNRVVSRLVVGRPVKNSFISGAAHDPRITMNSLTMTTGISSNIHILGEGWVFDLDLSPKFISVAQAFLSRFLCTNGK